MSSTTMSISLDLETKKDIEAIASEMRISRSDVIRSLVRKNRLEKDLNKISSLAKRKLQEFDITTWDQLEELMG
jgi:predicted transcriptional regulator